MHQWTSCIRSSGQEEEKAEEVRSDYSDPLSSEPVVCSSGQEENKVCEDSNSTYMTFSRLILCDNMYISYVFFQYIE